MPALSRHNARKLLRSVNNQPHASSEDHEDDGRESTIGKQTSKQRTRKTIDIDVNADPISSSEDNEAPSSPGMRQSPSTTPRNNSRCTATSSKVTPRIGRKAQSVRPPKAGAFTKGRVYKDSFKEQDKENSSGSSSSSGNRDTEETVYFGMGDTPPKNKKTKNVHTAPVGFQRKSFGKDKRNNASAKVSKPDVPKKGDLSHVDELDNALSDMLDRHEHGFVEMSDEEPSPPPAKRVRTIQRLPAGYATSSNATFKDSQTTTSSSPLTSIDDYDDKEMDALDEGLEQSLKRDEDTICALCQDEVDPQEQKQFWSEHYNRTVRDQMLFCKEHKLSKAQKNYKALGYPQIDWASLPGRIRSFQPDLIALLRNDTEEESTYRQKHAERLVSGKAASLPSKRRHRKVQAIEKEILDNFDASSSSTGYYGPRGKRIMMEVITADLSDVIREVAAKDPVVGRSGFAMFVQAVLVPELTLLLVMEDNDVGKAVAEGLVRESGELGTMLHEEIDDEVRLGSEDEEEQ